jgi:hypothetical protein
VKKKIARKPATKSKLPPVKLPKGNPKKMNALDKAIMEGRTLPTKGRKKFPPDYDVIMPGMGYTKPTKKKPPRKIQGR